MDGAVHPVTRVYIGDNADVLWEEENVSSASRALHHNAHRLGLTEWGHKG